MEGNTATQQCGPIGIFDSGLGGLTILDGIRHRMPQYDFIYLGDNARAPYGTRSFDVVYQFTLQAVEKLFSMGCPLIILACNTASAKALRSIQQKYLPQAFPNRRVLGVIRPTAEVVGTLTKSNHIGILATEGTVRSESYKLEIQKLYPATTIVGQACPMWVPLVENGEYDKPGADYFIKDSIDKLLTADSQIDTIILGCTHYPLLLPKIKQYTPKGITLIPQGKYIAESLQEYLQRHQEMEHNITKGGTCKYFTTESSEKFSESASVFLNEPIEAIHITL
jgi:glutamate racemase